MKEIQLTKGFVTLLDDDDYAYILRGTWYPMKSKDRKRYYVVGNIDGRKGVLMHREIMGANKGELVDHIDGDGLNNQKCNLRICTNAQNMRNREKNSNNLSGFKGVSWYKDYQKWRAAIMVDGIQKNIGYFLDKEEAARAYDRAALEYFGEFAYLNFTAQKTK